MEFEQHVALASANCLTPSNGTRTPLGFAFHEGAYWKEPPEDAVVRKLARGIALTKYRQDICVDRLIFLCVAGIMRFSDIDCLDSKVMDF